MKLNPYDARLLQMQQHQKSLEGKGIYVYRNITKGSLILPKPAMGEVKSVPSGGVFQGDSYFMFMVKTGELQLVRTIIAAETAKSEDKTILNEGLNMGEKLITEQPPIVTDKGMVEYVVEPEVESPKKTKKDEKNESKTEKSITLINESPIDGIDII